MIWSHGEFVIIPASERGAGGTPVFANESDTIPDVVLCNVVRSTFALIISQSYTELLVLVNGCVGWISNGAAMKIRDPQG